MSVRNYCNCVHRRTCNMPVCDMLKCKKYEVIKDMPSATCTWKYDNIHDYYETECGSSFMFSDGEKEEGFVYCPYCGKKIEEPPQ